MVSGDLQDVGHRGILDAVASSVRARRRASLDELLLVLDWADLHSVDPQTQPGAVPISQGGERFLTLGGDGTPQDSEFCWAELALARETGVIATRNLAADALDLPHRLPRLFGKVCALELEVWVARRIAAMSRALSRADAALVDAALAAATQQPAGALLTLTEAKVIEADPDAHRRRIALDEQATGVWRARPRTGDRLGGEAGACEPATGRIAAVLALLRGPADAADDTDQTASPRPARPRRSAVLHLHLTPSTLYAGDGVVRCDELGPLLLSQVTRLLEHHHVTLQPVIDLNAVHAVNGYEHPTRMRERALLRTPGGDAFPYSASRRALDHDHVVPYDPGGPPGQTNDRNHAPLARSHHRIKTHARGWQVAARAGCLPLDHTARPLPRRHSIGHPLRRADA